MENILQSSDNLISSAGKFPVDLHLHTNISDGDLSPEEIVKEAMSREVKVIAITDHDTVDGIDKAVRFSQGKNIKVISGIEFSCQEIELGFKEVHVIGLFINHNNSSLRKITAQIMKNREEQRKAMVKKLNELGFEIDFAEVRAIAKGAVGRSHIARVLMKHYPTKFKNTHEVFEQYLNLGRPAYVEGRKKISIEEAVKIIHKSGGLAILAHPNEYADMETEQLINYFTEAGGDGLEGSYPYDVYSKIKSIDSVQALNKINFVRQIITERKLLESGGSDFHGPIKRMKIGEWGLSLEKFKKLEDFWKAKNQSLQ